MKRLLHVIKNRISNRKGMSLGEVLVSVIIILLVTGTLTTTVTLAYQQFNKSMQVSESESLASTVRTILTNEFAYVTQNNISLTSGGKVEYIRSQNYVVSSSDDDFKPNFFADKSTGHVLYGDTTTSVQVLGNGSYSRNIGVYNLSITYSSGYFTISFDVGPSTDKIYYSSSFKVQWLNAEEDS